MRKGKVLFLQPGVECRDENEEAMSVVQSGGCMEDGERKPEVLYLPSRVAAGTAATLAHAGAVEACCAQLRVGAE